MGEPRRETRQGYDAGDAAGDATDTCGDAEADVVVLTWVRVGRGHRRH